MKAVRILDGDTERIEAVMLDGSLTPITGLGTVLLSIRRVSNGHWYDFNDDTFKASGWTTRQQAMTETDSTNDPGQYHYDFDTSAITNPTADDTYMLRVDQSAAANVPQFGELKVAQWVQDLFDEHTATQVDIAAVQADTDNIQTRLPAALVSGRMDSDVGAMQAGVVDATAIATGAIDADALATDAVNEVRDSILSDSTPFAGANIDAAVSTRAQPGDAMDLVAGAVDAAAVATDAIDADALAADAVTEIQNGLSTSAEIAAVQADTDDIQTRLPATLVSGRMDASVGAMVAGVVTSTAIATDAIDADALAASAVAEITDAVWTEALPGAYGAGEAGRLVGDNLDAAVSSRATQADILSDATPFPGADIDAAISSRSSHSAADVDTAITGSHGAGSYQTATGFAVPGDAMDLVAGAVDAAALATDAIDSDALAASAVAEIQSGLATGAAVASVQADTDDIQTRLPAALVGGRMDSDVGAMQPNVLTASALATDAVNEIRDALLADSTPFNGANIDAAISSRAVPGDQMALTAAAVVALVDDVWDENVVAAHGSASTSGFLLRALGAALSQRTNNPNLNALLGVADAAGVDLPEQINTELEVVQGHGAGLWTGGGGTTDWTSGEKEQIRFRLAMDGVQTDPTTNTGTIEDILADTDSLDTTKVTVARANNLDEITAARLAELDAANLPADIASVQADTDDIQTRLPAALVGGRMDSDVAVIQAAALAAINNQLEVVSGHGAGSWQASGGLTAQNIRDAMKLAPSVGAPAAGSVDQHLDDIETDTNAIDLRLPSDPADESNQLAAHGVTQAAIAALQDLSIADVQTALTNQGYTVARAAALDNLDATISSIATLIGGLNDLSQADVQSAMTAQGYTVTRAALLDNLTNLDSSISGVLSAIAALNDLSLADVQAAMTAQGYTAARGALLSNLDVAVSSVIAAIAALNDIDISDVQTALDNQGLTTARTTLLDNLDATISSIAVLIAGLNDLDATETAVAVWDTPGSSHNIASTMGALLNAAGLAAGVTDWTSGERDQIRFRLAMDGAQTDPTTGTGTLEDILADTDAIDTRLPSDPADESLQQAAHTATQLAVAGVQADTDDIQTRLPAALVGGRMDSDVGNMQTDTLDANALAADAVAEIQAGLALELGEVLGLLHKNTYIDNTSYDAEGQITGARIRTFDTRANALAATDGGVGEPGELRTYTAVTTWEAPGRMESYRLVLEP